MKPTFLILSLFHPSYILKMMINQKFHRSFQILPNMPEDTPSTSGVYVQLRDADLSQGWGVEISDFLLPPPMAAGS